MTEHKGDLREQLTKIIRDNHCHDYSTIADAILGSGLISTGTEADKAAALALTERDGTVASELLAALKAAKGYLLNAAIDLETGAPKTTALRTIHGGIRVVDAALSKATGQAPQGQSDTQTVKP